MSQTSDHDRAVNSGTALSALNSTSENGVLALLFVGSTVDVKLVREPSVARDHSAL